MNMNHPAIETDARRLQLADRVARATEPRIHGVPRRHRMAQGLRRFADRLDG